MKGYILAFALAVGWMWLAPANQAEAGQGCCCAACCQTYGTYSNQGYVQVYRSPDLRGVPYTPQYRSTYVGHRRTSSARGEYWERQYGPFGPRGFDW